MNDKSTSWLDLPPEQAVAAAKEVPEHARLVSALAALTPRQRRYIGCLWDCEFEPRAARKMMREQYGSGVSFRTALDWDRRDPRFAEAVSAMRAYFESSFVISKAAILAKTVKLVDDCRAVVPYTDKQGNSFDKPVDASAAANALSLLAKLTGTLQEASDRPPPVRQLPQLIVQIVGNATVRTPDIIDGEVIHHEEPKP